MAFFRNLWSRRLPVQKSSRKSSVALAPEALESRLTPYALSGDAWIHPELITLSFVPDETVLTYNSSGVPIGSNLQASFNARFGSATTWQNEILKAAQAWAQQTNINFKVVADNGAEVGTLSNQQGDANVGDIRIGGYSFGNSFLAEAYLPPNNNNTDYAGDINFNTSETWNVGSTYDLYTVALHEIGHALGLYHGASGSAMYGSYQGTKTGLATDDINGIQAVAGWTNGTYTSPGYGGNRDADLYDAAASNGTSGTATTVTSSINTTTKTALLSTLDITTTSDVDYYKFVVPTGLGGTLSLKAQSTGLSLLAPSLTLYNSSLTQLATATAGTDYDGATVSVNYSVTAGQTYYVKVQGAGTTAFGTGKYALAMGFANVVAPTAASPDTTTANDPDPNIGGGQAVKISLETGVNSSTTGTQETQDRSTQSVAADALGNYVVVWSSSGQDGSGYGVYAQRYSVLGFPIGNEFRANTTTSGDQQYASVAMSPSGSFVITWSSKNQDTSTSYGVYAQRYNFLGVAEGSEFRVNTTTSSDQKISSAAMDSNGNFVIVWEGNGTGDSSGIFGQRYNSQGVAQGGEFRVNSTTEDTQHNASVSMNGSGDFVVVWASGDESMNVYARRYNAAGVAQTSEFRVNTTTSGDQEFPSVSMNAAGAFVVTWSSYGQDGSGYGVYAQRYDLLGNAQGAEFRLNNTTSGNQQYSRVSLDASANFLVTWSSYGQDAASSWGVYARQYNSSGVAYSNEFLVNTTTAGDQRYSGLAMNGIGTATVVWSGNGTGDSAGIYYQRYQLINALNPLSGAHGFHPDGECGCGNHHAVETEDHTGCGCSTCTDSMAVAATSVGPTDDLESLAGLLQAPTDHYQHRQEELPTRPRGQPVVQERASDDTRSETPRNQNDLFLGQQRQGTDSSEEGLFRDIEAIAF